MGTPAYSVVVDENEPYKNIRSSWAYQYSGNDKDFVLLLNAECGSWNCGLHPLKYEREGKLWSDGYLCGISAYYQTEAFLKAKESHKDGDWKEQVKICYDLYKEGVVFYGWDVRHERGKDIVFNQ